MPSFGTYSCTECGDTQDYRKPDGQEFPEALECPFCKTHTARRDFSYSRARSIVETGNAGNAADGYSGRSGRKSGIDPTAAKHW